MSFLWAVVQKQLGRQPLQKPLPTLQSVALGLLLAHLNPSAPPRFVGVRNADRAGWSHWKEPTGGAAGWYRSPLLGSPISASSQRSTVSWLLQQSTGSTAGGWISTTSPREEVSQHRRGQLRGLSWGGSSYPCPASTARAIGGRCNCSLAGGRKGGGETGLRPRERQRREN